MFARWRNRFLGWNRGSRNPPQPARRTPGREKAPPREETRPMTEPQRRAYELRQREFRLRESAEKRWNAAIDPRGKEFSDKVTMFKEMLEDPKRTIQSILDEFFTSHEQNLLLPAQRSLNRMLAKIQRMNSNRYRALMKLERYSMWADKADSMEVILTMLWFGLPVPPLSFGRPCYYLSGTDTDDEDAEAQREKVRQEGAKTENSLRFLNSYGQRHFGRDNLREPDPTYEAYYTFNRLYPAVPKRKRKGARKVVEKETLDLPSASLRGGGLSEDVVDTDMDDFNESDIEVESMNANCGSADADADDGGDEGTLASAGISLRGGSGGNPAGSGATFDARVDETVGHMQTTPTKQRPNVHFATEESEGSEGTGYSEEPSQEKSEKAKGKEPARDPTPPPRRTSNPFIDKQGEPRVQPHTREEQDRESREKAYTTAPSVWTGNRIPDNAPPVEKTLKFGSDNVPTISIAVMTPTEQWRMQKRYYDLRNLLLERSQKCPYLGCNRVFSMADEDRMQKHLADVHVGEKCNFCDEILYRHWTEGQRRAHFLGTHSKLFLNWGDMKNDNSFNVRPECRVDYDRESPWTFCARCGRDHTKLDAWADRTHHDNVCYPGSRDGPHDWVACQDCGVRIPTRNGAQPHECREVINTEEYPYCEECGLPAGLFSDVYRAKHLTHCRGHSNVDAKYCPWCRVELGQAKLAHLRECPQRPDDEAQGPLDPETGYPWTPLPAFEDRKGEENVELPQVCPLCKETIMHLDANRLMKHFDDHHGDEGVCPFCKLDYKRRGWAGDHAAKVAHMDDHIHSRKVEMAADLALGSNFPDDHPYRRHVLRARDYDDLLIIREIEHENGVLHEKCDELEKDVAYLREKLADTQAELDECKSERAKAADEAVEKPKKADKAAGKGASTALPVTPANPAPKPTKNTPKKTSNAPAAPPKTQTSRKNKRKDPATAYTDSLFKPQLAFEISDLSEDEDEEFRAEAARLKAANKCRRTMQQDPSYRPRRESRVDDDEEVVEEEERGTDKKAKRVGFVGESGGQGSSSGGKRKGGS